MAGASPRPSWLSRPPWSSCRRAPLKDLHLSTSKYATRQGAAHPPSRVTGRTPAATPTIAFRRRATPPAPLQPPDRPLQVRRPTMIGWCEPDRGSVGVLGKHPSCIRPSHTSRPVRPTMSMPAHRPRRTHRGHAVDGRASRSSRRTRPSSRARAGLPVASIRTTSMPTAQASGLPPNVLPCLLGWNQEEKASIAKYQELAKNKPVKFKEVKGESGKVSIAFEYPDGQLREAKMSEAFGTADLVT